MDLILIQDGLGKYVIKDQNEKILYMCKHKGFNYYIFDENQLQLAEVKYNLFSKNKYKLYMNGTLIDEVKSDNKTPKEYTLINKNWRISSDITYSEFHVTNEKQEVILSMKNDLSDDPNKWDINIMTSDKLFGIINVVTILSIAKK